MANLSTTLFFFLLVVVSFGPHRTCSTRGSEYLIVERLLDELLGNEDRGHETEAGTAECRRSLAEIIHWLKRTFIVDEAKQAAVMLADYENSINITEYNKNRTIEMLTDFDEWFLGVSKQASDYLVSQNQTLSVCGDPWKRMLERYSMDGNLIPLVREKRKLLHALIADMESHYATSAVEKDGRRYRLDPELTAIMSDSRDYETLLWAWKEWHDMAASSKTNFSDMVNLLNEAALEHGFNDAGELWKISDLEDTGAEQVLLKLMEEVKPLYEQLHAFARARLLEEYHQQVDGTEHEEHLDPDGPIPAHLFGNMWAQQWSALEDLLLPYPDAPPPPNVTHALLKQNYTVEKMFRLAEEFFVSLGFQPMTDIFWNKSVIRRPDDPNIEMVCHASAYDMMSKDDYRIKMCTEIDSRDLETIHHEMGHIAYYMEYRKQPIVFRSGGTPAFHEAVGDTIALSVMSPKHLEEIGLVEKSTKSPRKASTSEVKLIETLRSIWRGEEEAGEGVDEIASEEDDEDEEEVDDDDDEEKTECDDECQIKLNTLMITALDKIAFLPFALSLELWRYGVFSGNITPDEYNSKWWELREKYQGIKPPVERESEKFDPGAKYHIVANVPYARYFYSFIAQFQFHEALCTKAGHHGELYNCDIYQSKKAGSKLRSMLSEGASKPWRELMKGLTGVDEFCSKSLLEYFKPLRKWLENENKGRTIGWSH